jgi:digeranylgeranylglycerophospholipid reductase
MSAERKSTKRSDVLVVGAGPSGLRVAARLAGRGYSVRVLERKGRVGSDVVCTGIIGADAVRNLGLPREPVVREIQDVRLVSPFDTVVTYRHPRPFAFVVDREAFDRALADEATSRGARIELGTRVEDLTVGERGVTADTVVGGERPARFSASFAVLATGVDTSLHRKCGLASPRRFLRGAQAEVAGPGPEETTIFVGKNLAPGAFAWMVPSAPGRTRVGLLTGGDAKARLKEFLPKCREHGLEDPGSAPIRTRPIAQGLVSRTVGERVLSVGEAAGQIKTTTGGGISYGLLCADLAAEVVTDCFSRGTFGVPELSRYENLWRKAIQKEILIGATTRDMCVRLSDRRVESLFRLAQTDGIIPIIRETADFDWPSGLIQALLRRLSFMKFFRIMSDRIGPETSS